ncbi:MAG: urate hydroxylase PuuD, partial [Nitrospira sp.]|nr:urate hydroxylase PuuD [Nitrospira sp.]
GAWLGTIMFINVWGIIWRNQKKVLGLVQATPEEKAKAARMAFLASRTNTMLSIPMLFFMAASSHAPASFF